jgi:hypothetical protein
MTIFAGEKTKNLGVMPLLRFSLTKIITEILRRENKSFLLWLQPVLYGNIAFLEKIYYFCINEEEQL